tara:strand:+ start:4927 stop:6540 length:1614 start_codon:yes stop_codon:yes gene_type:complete
MTQADLPQLSLRRYVDLVKRRRWRVVPVSVLGLMIGGLVAFFIPRFYVAQTTLLHQQFPTGAEDRDNPFKLVVDTARSSIPLYVEDAIRELKWQEYTSADEFTQQQFARGVESRVKVIEQNGGDRKREYATLKVEYRDTDGKRSEQLLNTLVQVWMKRRTIEMREPARQRAREAKAKAERALETVRQCRLDRQILQRQYGINPEININTQQREYAKQVELQGEEKKALTEKKAAHAKLAREIALDEERLNDTAARIAPVEAMWFELALKDEKIRPLALMAAKKMMEFTSTFRPGTSNWYKAKRDYERQVAYIKELLPKVSVDAEGLVPNPKHTELREKIEAAKKVLAKLQAEIDAIEKALEKEEQRLARLKDGFPAYENKLSELREAETAREEALAEETEANKIDAQLTHDLPVKQIRVAQVPPAPTEPNIMVVATSGCVLGLFAAIALILLFDFLQGSFKTIEDVERGLGVPVLGGVSHLETEMERHDASRSRRRISLVAAAALLMVTAIVTVFYLDPNRLPAVVRNILNVLLVDS